MTVTARFFCAPSTSALGEHSLAVVEALISVGVPVRLLALYVVDGASFVGDWGKHRGLFVGPVEGTYANLVSGTPIDWGRLWTAGVKNVLVTHDEPPALALNMMAARQYPMVVVPTEQISLKWKASGKEAVVLPRHWLHKDADALRLAITS